MIVTPCPLSGLQITIDRSFFKLINASFSSEVKPVRLFFLFANSLICTYYAYKD